MGDFSNSEDFRAVFFIDSRVTDYESLIAALDPDTEWFLLYANEDGVAQIQRYLAGYSGLDAIHIISHGSPGTIYLGSMSLSSDNLQNYQTDLERIGASLSIEGDILLYGCDVAAGETGQAFIESLASFTAADVGASTNLTGTGGDWVLESSTGNIETASIDGLLLGYDGTLADTIPGNTTSTQTLAIGSSATSAIDFNSDTDWWRVQLTVGYAYQIWIEGWSSAQGTLFDPYLAIYNSAGVFQHAADDIGLLNWDAYTSTIPSGTGAFFLSAEESGNNATGTYRITIWQDQLVSTASAAAISVNGAVTDRIGWQNDTSDWFRVSLTAGTLYQFDLLGSDGDGGLVGLTLIDPWLRLRDSAGNLLDSDNDNGLGHNARLFFIPNVSGTYFLDVSEFGQDANGIYQLIVNSSPVSSAITLGQTVTGSIDFSGDVDGYSLSLTAGIAYGFALSGVSLLDPYLEILDANGITVADDDDSGAGLNSLLTFTPAATGTYYLGARESGNNATGSYTAVAWQLPTVSIANPTVVEANSGTTDLVFNISLSAVSPVDVTVVASTLGSSTATVNVDYQANEQNLTIPAGETVASFTVKVNGDSVFEPTEALHVLLSAPANAVLGDDNAYGFIFDNDKPYRLPTDSYVTYQWYLYPSTGVNVFPVWNDYTGNGVRVAVFDWGIDPNHPDLDDNLLASLGRKASDLSAGGDPIQSYDNHGTAVAGTIAAERNGIGIIGVAYDANLVSIYNSGSTSEITNAFTYASNFDIINDSWGYAPQDYTYSWQHWAFLDNFLEPSFSAAGQALANLANTGRGGLGTVVVQSAGNSFAFGDNTNLHNFQNSQYVITVAATDYVGSVTSYSSPGASILVAAPGGDVTDSLSDIYTTDRVGSAGYNSSDYTFIQGTSFSAPIVSGVVALMLEANPDLGYRDVQEILAYSARRVSDSSNDWEYNGASNWNGGGLHYDALRHDLGFGLVDARAAVRLAETWLGTPHTAANRTQITATSTPNKTIPDGGGINATAGAYDYIVVNQSMAIERAEVTLNVTHPWVGDLSVLLTSPEGTTSFLIWRPQENPLSAFGSSQDNIYFTLDTVLDWGENSVGLWQIGIFDNAYGDVGTLDSWTLNLIGKPASTDDQYIYTDEFAEACTDQVARATLTDTGGMDTLNAAACSSAVTINLTPGAVSTIDGRSLTIAASTTIENAYGGDLDDTISGNSSSNELRGMRGDDTLTGGLGNDIFWFSTVNDGVDTITDFSPGDRIYVKGANFSGAVLAGDETSLALNQVCAETSDGETTVRVCTDLTPGYDLAIKLTGAFKTSQLRLNGSFIEFNNAPQITSGTTATVTENAVASTVIYTATAGDVDANDTKTWSLGGTDADSLRINISGQVSLKASANYEAKNSYSFDVAVTDAAGLTDTLAVTLSVSDVSEAPELAQPSGPTFIDTAVNDTFAAVSGTLLATDQENDVLAYGISGGTDGGTTVSLVGNYGTLTVTKNTGAWFYAPNDAAIEALNGDVTDNFTVTVSDSSLASTQLFTVNLVGSYDPTVATAKYFVLAGSGANYIDYNLNAGPLGFYGQYTTQVGTTGVDAIHVRPGTAVDFTLSGASSDKVYLDGNHDDYAAYLSGSIMTLVRGTGEAQEFVRVTKGTNLASSDVLVFADGTVSTWDIYNLLKNGTPMPALGSETSLDPFAPAADGSTLSATVKAFSLDSTGEIFAPVGHGMRLIAVGSIGVDNVYVGDGSSVDATLLGASSDNIYMRGDWTDYSKSIAGSVITFTRTINGELETVKVVGGTGALNDRLIFADGAVQSYNAKTALLGDLNVDIHSVSGYDANTVTPIINAVRMVDGGSYLAAPDKKDAYLIDGSQVLHATLEGFALGDVLEFANLGETLLTFDRGVPDDGATTLIAGNCSLTLIGLTSDNFSNLGEFQALYGAEAVLFL